MLLDITLHRIGGTGDYPRFFSATRVPLTQTAHDRARLDCTQPGYLYMDLLFTDWERLDHEWSSCLVSLADMNGSPIGRRPALVYTRPHDVGTYVQILSEHRENGMFSIGLRWLQD